MTTTEPVTLEHQALDALSQSLLGGGERHLGVSQVAEERKGLGLAFEKLFPAMAVQRRQPSHERKKLPIDPLLPRRCLPPEVLHERARLLR